MEDTGDMTMHLERGDFVWNLNTFAILGTALASIIATAVGWGVIYENMRNGQANLQGQISDINTHLSQEASERKIELSTVQQQMNQIPTIEFQVTRALEASAENKKSIEELNSKVVMKLDNLVDQINKVSTQVQVLSSKFDDSQGKPDRTLFRTPIASKDGPAQR